MLTSEQIKRINEYYILELKNKEIIVRTKENNKVQTVSVKKEYVNLGFGNINERTSKAETAKLLNEGQIYRFSMTDFLKDYFKLNDSQILELQSQSEVDARTQKALKEEMERIGLIAYDINKDLVSVSKISDVYFCYFDVRNSSCGWTDKNEFLIQLVITVIDDYYVENYTFKTIPNKEILDEARLIQCFVQKLQLGLVKAEYHKLTDKLDIYDRRIPEKEITHWLDNSGTTIVEKIELAMDEQRRY